MNEFFYFKNADYKLQQGKLDTKGPDFIRPDWNLNYHPNWSVTHRNWNKTSLYENKSWKRSLVDSKLVLENCIEASGTQVFTALNSNDFKIEYRCKHIYSSQVIWIINGPVYVNSVSFPQDVKSHESCDVQNHGRAHSKYKQIGNDLIAQMETQN